MVELASLNMVVVRLVQGLQQTVHDLTNKQT